MSVGSCLPLQSSLHSVSATWRKTQNYQVVPWDHSRVPWISATLLRDHLTQRNHFQPHTRKTDKWALNNYSSAAWLVLKICVEKNLPELFNLGNLLRLWSDHRHILHGRIVSLHLRENICHSYSDNGYLCDFNNVIFNQVILKPSVTDWAGARGVHLLCLCLRLKHSPSCVPRLNPAAFALPLALRRLQNGSTWCPCWVQTPAQTSASASSTSLSISCLHLRSGATWE